MDAWLVFILVFAGGFIAGVIGEKFDFFWRSRKKKREVRLDGQKKETDQERNIRD